VLGLILPDAPASDIPLVWEHGILGPVAGDPYRTMPARAWWRRPVSWRRHGYALTGFGLLLRRGTIWRKLAIFPLARLQGVSLSQGPIDRAQRVSGAQVHSVQGPITGYLSGLERTDALELINGVSRAAVLAAARDQTHRWGEHGADAGGRPGGTLGAAGYAMPPQPSAPSVHAQPGAAPAAPPAPVSPPAPSAYARPVAPPPPPAYGQPAPPPAPPGQPEPPAVPPAPPVAPSAPPTIPGASPAPPVAPPAPPVAPPAPPAPSAPPASTDD